MGTAIRIRDDIYLAAQRVAGAECRSIPQQIEFWALVGKTALENPDLPVDFVRELLISRHTDRALAEPFVPAAQVKQVALSRLVSSSRPRARQNTVKARSARGNA